MNTTALFNSLIGQLTAEKGRPVTDAEVARILKVSQSTLLRYKNGNIALDQITMLMRLLQELPKERWIVELDKQLGIPNTNKYNLSTLLPESFLIGLQNLVSSRFIGNSDRIRDNNIIKLGSTEFSEAALKSNILITGGIGSGKTSSVILPLLRQICNNYNEEDGTHIKWGGIFFDCKHDNFGELIYFLHKSGRNPIEDITLLTLRDTYDIIQLEDENGVTWLISGEGPEASILKSAGIVEGGDHKPCNVELNFIGWREKEGKLYKLLFTNSDKTEVYATPLVIRDKPGELKYIRKYQIPTGIGYNISNQLLKNIKKAGTGQDKFWTDTAEKHLIQCKNCLEVIDGENATIPASITLATDDKEFSQARTTLAGTVKKLCKQEKELSKTLQGSNPKKDYNNRPLLEAMRATIAKASGINKYFDEWQSMHENTKKTIQTWLLNNYAWVKSAPTFFARSTADPKDCVTTGKIVVLQGEYESPAVLTHIGKIIKADIQKACKAHTPKANEPRGNCRPIIFFTDEAQTYVDSDDIEYLGSRHLNLIHIFAAQSEAVIQYALGEAAAQTYIQNFCSRIWLRNTDYGTNKNASNIIGAAYKPEAFTQLDVMNAIIFNIFERGSKKTTVYKGKHDSVLCEPENQATQNILRWYWQVSIENTLCGSK